MYLKKYVTVQYWSAIEGRFQKQCKQYNRTGHRRTTRVIEKMLSSLVWCVALLMCRRVVLSSTYYSYKSIEGEAGLIVVRCSQ